MEPVRGLSIQGSCAAIPVGVKRLFVANILTGKPVSFLWTFDLHHHHQASHIGKEVRLLQYLTYLNFRYNYDMNITIQLTDVKLH